MATSFETVSDLIAVWPGLAAFAGDVGVSGAVAGAWGRRGSIPGRYWAAIVDAAQRRGIAGVTVEVLADLHDVRRASAAA